MTRSQVPGPGAQDALDVVREILHGDPDERTAGTFMRGLTLGALIGAAVAGSAIWQRRQRRHEPGARGVSSRHEARRG